MLAWFLYYISPLPIQITYFQTTVRIANLSSTSHIPTLHSAYSNRLPAPLESTRRGNGRAREREWVRKYVTKASQDLGLVFGGAWKFFPPSIIVESGLGAVGCRFEWETGKVTYCCIRTVAVCGRRFARWLGQLVLYGMGY